MLSPTHPQMWMVPVDNVGDNPGQNVRFMISVRSSPPVDGLWMQLPSRLPTPPSAVDTTPSPGDPYVRLAHCAHLPTVNGPRPHSPPTTKIPVITHKKPDIHKVPRAYDDDYLSPYSDFSTRLDADAGGYLPYCLTRHWQHRGGRA